MSTKPTIGTRTRAAVEAFKEPPVKDFVDITVHPRIPEPEAEPEAEIKLSGIPRAEQKRPFAYSVARNTIPEQLQILVQTLLPEGWEPIGGIAIDSRDGTFYQALVKRG